MYVAVWRQHLVTSSPGPAVVRRALQEPDPMDPSSVAAVPEKAWRDSGPYRIGPLNVQIQRRAPCGMEEGRSSPNLTKPKWLKSSYFTGSQGGRVHLDSGRSPISLFLPVSSV